MNAAASRLVNSPISRGLRAIFKKRSHVFLASREDMFHVNRLLSDIPRHEAAAFIGIVGGLGTLNFIERLQPSSIYLIDVNKDQIDYGACIIELISLAADRREFVESVFSRSFREDETAFLAQPGDPLIFDRTLAKISRPEAFQRFFAPIRDAGFYDGLKIPGNHCCRFLKLYGPERGTPMQYNFFYFGQGWLENDLRFASLKKALAASAPTFICASIARLQLDLRENYLYFHASNIIDSFPGHYWQFVAAMHRRLAGREGDLVHFSTYHPLSQTSIAAPRPVGADVHSDCAAKVAVHTEGKRVLEVIPGHHCFGREMRSEDHRVVHYRDLDSVKQKFDVVVSHILYGSGLLFLSKAKFRAFLGKILKIAPEIVIVEHNKRSLDFRGGRRLDEGDIILLLGRACGCGLQVKIDYARGLKDDRRNIIMRVRR